MNNLMFSQGMTNASGGSTATATATPTPTPIPTSASPSSPSSPSSLVPVPSFLEGNPYFSAGFGLAVMGFGFTLMRRAGIGMQLMAERSWLTTLEIHNRDPAFPWILRWLHQQTAGKTRRVTVETTRRQTQSGKSITSFSLVPSQGKHFLKYQGIWLMIERERELGARGGEQGGNIWECIKFTTIGRNPNVYEHLMREAQLLAASKDSDYTTIYTSWGYQGWKPFGNPRRKRNIESVILDEGIAARIINDVYEFLTCRQWYYDRGIPYRRGYLLYGDPGSGKSSFVTALAGHIGYDICVMSLATPGLTDDHLAVSLINVPEKSIILFEDVDCLFISRSDNIHDSKNKLNKKNKSIEGETGSTELSLSSISSNLNTASNYLTFSGFLNALDGVSAGEERIVFMTTNHVNKLDPALIRPGRVDVMEYLGPATPFQIEKMFERFYRDYYNSKDNQIEKNQQISKFVKSVQNKGISMAELQEYFLLHKHDAQTAIEDTQQWIESLLNSPRRRQWEQLYKTDKDSHPISNSKMPKPPL